MLSVEEAFERFADGLTPNAEQLREVDQLHELLRQKFADMQSALQSIELLAVTVVDGAPRPLFAFILRAAEFQSLNSWASEIRHRVRGRADSLPVEGSLRPRIREPLGLCVEGSPLTFHEVTGTLGARELRSSPYSALRNAMRLGETLPSLRDDAVGPSAARLGRVVLRAWGEASTTYRLVAVAAAVVERAGDASGGLAQALRDVLASVATNDLSAVGADHALRLSREGRLLEAHAQWRRLFGNAWPVDPGPPVGRDVVSAVAVQGLRSIASAQLALRDLTVLIGENGSGKSTLVEACELLRRVASPAFLDEINTIHGGLRHLQRHGANEVVLRAEVSGADLPLQYEVSLAADGGGAAVTREQLVVGRLDEGAPAVTVLTRNRTKALVPARGPDWFPPTSDGLTLTSFGTIPPDPAISRMVAALKAIEVHVPFEVTPAWVGRAHGRQSVLRGSSMIQSATALERLGVNLANAYHALRSDGSEAHWRETMDYVRLGLGERIESVNTRADVAGGAIALWVKLRGRDEQIPAASLSEGTLAYLAFVALFRLPSKRSLLVFDEPELHLHPRLLARVMGFFHGLAERCPVVLATHSRRLLDELHDPAGSAVLCELDDADTTRLRYPDRAALDEWLVDYEGLGRILDAGYEAEVMVRREGA